MPIAGNACYINAKHLQVLQIFPHLIITLLIGHPVKLGITNVMVVIKYKA